jgi:hypothetical protein
MVTLMVVGMAAVQAARRARTNPSKLSAARVLRTIRRVMNGLRPDPRNPSMTLREKLGRSLSDDYRRREPKGSRTKIRSRNTPIGTKGRPNVVRADKHLRKLALEAVAATRE